MADNEEVATTDIEPIEVEVDDSVTGESSNCSCSQELKALLKELKTNCEEVTIFIQTGSQCCKRTGCICAVDDCFVTLAKREDSCQRIFILLDCICAVKNCVEEA
ncbi:hypothetical protein [Halanaerobaculum tunisiense]